jgi:hypothetical protein
MWANAHAWLTVAEGAKATLKRPLATADNPTTEASAEWRVSFTTSERSSATQVGITDFVSFCFFNLQF